MVGVIPEVPFKEEQLVGSGDGIDVHRNDANDTLTSITDQFIVVPEQVGQLYAYRINSSAVILGTRKDGTFGATIGVGSPADGIYQCLAENSNAKSDFKITVHSIPSK